MKEQPEGARGNVEILLVEDNPSDVILTQIAMKECKIANQLQVASDGEQALRMLRGQGTRPPGRGPIRSCWI